MANFALILPRPEMVAQAGRIARQLGMKVVLNQYAVTEQILDVAADARKLGADIVVARGLHASILREKTDFPIAEIRLTGPGNRPAAPQGQEPGAPCGQT